MDINDLQSNGIDYIEGLDRFRKNKNIFHEVLIDFIDDESFQESKKAFLNNDYDNLLLTVHELKGVSGNIGLSTLHDKAAVVVDLLRAKKTDEVPLAFAQVESEWNKVVGAILRQKEELALEK